MSRPRPWISEPTEKEGCWIAGVALEDPAKRTASSYFLIEHPLVCSAVWGCAPPETRNLSGMQKTLIVRPGASSGTLCCMYY